MDAYHVIPINDLREHEAAACCWCNPVLEPGDEDHADVWAHNSMDRREHTYEKGLLQ